MSNVTITPAPSPNGTNYERLFLVRAPSRDPKMAQDGKLGDALRQKYKTPREALKALGLDESLLDASRLAFDAKRKARDSVLSPDSDHSEYRALSELLAQNLEGELHETAQRLLDRLHGKSEETDGVIDEEPDEREDEPDEDRDEQQRQKRKEVMRMLAEKGRDEWGWDDEKVRHEIMTFPRTGLHHLGGQLGEDAESVLEELGMGNGPVPEYEPKVTDRKRRARDRRMARDEVRKHFGTDRLEGRGSDMCNYGDREPPALAYDERSSDAASEVDAWFGTGRIGRA